MLNFDVNSEDFQSQIKKAIEEQQKKIDFNKIYRGIGEVLQTAMEDQFDKQGAYWGKSWTGLRPSTIKQREKKGKWPGSILQVTGALRRSFTYNVVGDKLVFGSNLEYAKYLHFGTKRMPARPLFAAFLTEEVKQEIREVIAKSLR